MKIQIHKFHFFLAVLMAFTSCKDWEQTIELPPNNNTTDSKRVIVMEEFTGASCVNCPAGIAISNSIAETYPNNVILIGLHSKFLGAPATKGQVDMRTPDAQAIEDFLGSWLAKPEAAINRLYQTAGQSYRIGNPDSWKSYVDAELKKAPEVDLQIKTVYNQTSRKLEVDFTVTTLKVFDKPIHLHCGITQSGIIADQLDNQTGKLVGFEHKHVLLKLLSPVSGDRLTNTATAQQIFKKSYEFTLPQDSILWKVEHLDVFGFASLDETEKYILQGAETKIQ
mgnify:CR=1 FL=1